MIQGTGALCTKLAMILFFNYLRKEDLLFTVKLCILVHDKMALLWLNVVNCWKLLKIKKLQNL